MKRRIQRGIAPWAIVAVALVASPGAQAQSRVANTVHNLSTMVSQPTGVCVFCHTPHNASPTRALWNLALPGVTYQLYSSSTLKATLDQPSGSSRLCLSCHDGILAMGNLRVPPPGGEPAIGPLIGPDVLGTDLSDDHPISFTYDSQLALNAGNLADPADLPASIRLEGGQLQCTSCHNPHEDQRPMFLRMDNQNGALCTACHLEAHWSGSSHAVSSATWNGSGTDPWPAGAYPTVAENACLNCHRSHSAGHPARLLAQATEPQNCTLCHDGNVAAKNVDAEFTSKPFVHPINSGQWTHDPTENPSLMTRHVTCVDCHNPHAATGTPATPPLVPGPLQGVSGVSLSGTPVAEAGYGYEVCFKCHGLSEPTTQGIARQDITRNIRLRVDPANASYHPLASTGKNPAILGLEPGYTASSLVTCTSCHTNDDWTSGGTAPAGPHGSRYEGVVGQQYETGDPTTESPATYALCYQCHNRDFLITDGAGTFSHQRHVVTDNASCAVCHDSHGSRQNQGLIDFMLRDRAGTTVVSPSSGGRLEYVATGPGAGSCYLTCHGKDHNPLSYP